MADFLDWIGFILEISADQQVVAAETERQTVFIEQFGGVGREARDFEPVPNVGRQADLIPGQNSSKNILIDSCNALKVV